MELPFRIGKYELDKQIGIGATGKVYHGIDTFSGGEVAMKVIDTSVLRDPGFNELRRKQFLNEAALAGHLAHPHIVSILEASVTDDAGYIVLEYVAGGNLVPHTFHDNLLPIGDVLQIIYKCCSALDYAFRQGIVHRDIKPGNIMLVSGSNIKVTDFGTAVFYREQITQAITEGTPAYMSLEHLRGERLSSQSDMYSLGVVAYELLTGFLPFDGDNAAQLFDAISTQDPLPPSTRRFGIPSELDNIVLRMMARDPQDRYPSWQDLEKALSGLGWFGTSPQEISDSDKFGMLRRMQELKDLPEPELWELVHVGKWYRLPERSVILREGEQGWSMYILASGTVRVVKRNQLLNIIKPGEFFGEMAYVRRGSRRNATIEAQTEITVAEFPFDQMEKLSSNCGLHLVQSLLTIMTERLALADERIVSMSG